MSGAKPNRSSIILWAVFFAFTATAIAVNWSPRLTEFDSTTGAVRLALIIVWIAFTAYSIQCSRHENLFRTVGKMSRLYWGRQIGIDLYISVFLSIGLVYLVTGSPTQTVFWGLAFIPFANQAILLFVILYLDRIIAISSAVM